MRLEEDPVFTMEEPCEIASKFFDDLNDLTLNALKTVEPKQQTQILAILANQVGVLVGHSISIGNDPDMMNKLILGNYTSGVRQVSN